MAYTNFTNCTEQEYLDIIYSQGETNRIRIWFNNVELEDAGQYCISLSGTNRMLPDDGSKRFSLDNFVAREYELILRDLPAGTTIADQVKISIGTLVDSENDIYEDVPIGIFNIQDKPETDQNKVTIKLRDNRVKFDFGYDAKPLIDLHSGSATYKQILNDICTKAGVTNDVTTFNGESIAVSIYDNTIKGSAYVAYIAEQAGAIPVITREGHLDFVYLNNLKTWRIPLSIVEKYEIGKPFGVERVVYESGIIKYETSQDETLETLYLDAANPYISSQAQVDDIFDIMEDFTIDSATTGRILGNPAIDAYDLIEIYDDDTDNTILKTLANNTYTFNGVHRNTFDTTIGEEERKENVTISSEATNRRWAKTEIDNLNATVTITAGKVENLEQSIEVLSTDLDSNIIPISVDENNIPFTAKTYQVGFTNKYVGEPIYITPTTNDLYNGVTTSATTTNINFTINNGTPLGRYVLTQDTTYQEGKSYFDSNYDELEEGVDYNVGDTITGTVYEVQTVSDLKYTFTWSYTDGGVTYTVSKMITISALYSEQQQEIVKSSTFPLDTNVLWYNTNDNKIYSYNGTDWVIVNSYDSQLDVLQGEINAKANASDVNQLTSTVANIQTNTYSKTQIQSIANGSGYFLSEDTVFGENTIYYTDTNGTVYTGSRTGSPLELGLYEYGAISAVISTEATFNRDGMTYAKTGAETTSTINQYGLEVDRTGTNEVALYAGYVPDDSFGDLYQSQTLVYTSNLVSRGYTEVGLHGRFEEYAGPNNEDGVGFFII